MKNREKEQKYICIICRKCAWDNLNVRYRLAKQRSLNTIKHQVIARLAKWLNKIVWKCSQNNRGGKIRFHVFRMNFCDRRMFGLCFCIFSTYDLFNIDQTYSSVSLNRHLYSLCDHLVREVNTVNHTDFRASYGMDRILLLLMAPFRLSMDKFHIFFQFPFILYNYIANKIHTSVRAQLQLIAVHKNMFIKSMIRKRMPSVIHNQRSQDGRIPPSSQAGDITANEKIHSI